MIIEYKTMQMECKMQALYEFWARFKDKNIWVPAKIYIQSVW